MIVEEEYADEIMDLLRSKEISAGAQIIGRVIADPKGRVVVITDIGGTRILDKPYGEPIPRVC